jgi:hypothetical protein
VERSRRLRGNLFQNASLRSYGSKTDEVTRSEEKQLMDEEFHSFHPSNKNSRVINPGTTTYRGGGGGARRQAINIQYSG